MSDQAATIDHELGPFPPSEEFSKQAVGQAELYDEAAADPEAFWARQARARFTWSKDFDKVLDWSNTPMAAWLVGGELNAAYNCADRHVEAGHGDRVAIHFVGEPGEERDITYADLTKQVQKAAGSLRTAGVEKGDSVAIYLPMIPEAVVAMLACARLGSVHSVVFGGFSSDALRTRIAGGEAKALITADGGYHRGKPSSLKPAVDDAVSRETTAGTIFGVQRTSEETAMGEKDVWWNEALEAAETVVDVENVGSEYPLVIFFTSCTTGKSKGIFHTTGGYLTQAAYTNAVVHDVLPETEVYWCTAGVGWVTGHSYIVYGPLANGTTQVLYEGTLDTPHRGRWWEIIQDKKVSILLHGSHRHPHMHEVGQGDPREVRLLEHSRARLGR